jgi:oligopeptidase B
MRPALSWIGICLFIAACSVDPQPVSPGETLAETLADLGAAEEEEMIAVPAPPMADARPHTLEIHGKVRIDNYYWLKERQDPEVIEYLERENAYTRAKLAHTQELQEKVFDEIVGRIKEDDSKVPYRLGDYYYYQRYGKGQEYPIYCRRRGSPEGEEEIMLDVNRLAADHEHLRVRGVEVSEDQNLLAFATDTVGRRLYTLRFRDLTTGKDLPDEIADVTGNHVWANDDRTVFYTKQHPETLRWYQIYRHVIGTSPEEDELVFEEEDEEFSVYVEKTKSRRFILIASEQTLSSEYHFLEADSPQGSFEIFLPREGNHEYSIDHLGDDFYIRTNWNARNFRLMATSISATSKEHWREIVAHRDDIYLRGAELFQDFLVVSERKDGLVDMRIIPWDGSEGHTLDFGEAAYYASFGQNRQLDTDILRYKYTSLTTPDSVFDYDMASRQQTLLKQDEVVGGFDSRDYVSERLWAPARDGARIPISIVYKRGFEINDTAPLLLYAYGSYGYSMDASFSVNRLSLLDRGFAYAIAHVRGGQELGRAWYESGKLLEKKNTFTDFIDCGRFLISEGYASPEKLFAMGGSAGGLLMGAVANMAPELFAGIVSRVPFVDVVTTMLDPDIPLTTSEYDEWGNPNEKQYYDYMLSYSPVDQLEAKAYPNILVTAGLHDSQVQYWEPAKYVAKLRTLKTDDRLLLLETNMEAGHSGASGRFKRHRETALAYAFMLDLAGVKE